MIIILRGTSGSGKSHIIYALINSLGKADETISFDLRNKICGYLWHKWKDRPAIAIIGRYETACGGCDVFSWPGAADEIAAEATRLELAGYRVILEGLIVSAWATARMLSLGPELHTIHLTTSLADCLKAVESRRAIRAAVAGKEVLPLNPHNTTKKHEGLFSCTRRQREAGMPVEELDREAARVRVFELMGVKELAPAENW